MKLAAEGSERVRAVSGEVIGPRPADSDRAIKDVADLTLGEYVRLLENPKQWEELGILFDRKTHIDGLNKMGLIRNDVMHFDPEGPSPDGLQTLRTFARFLKILEKKLA